MAEAPIRTFISELARPYAFYTLATASMISIVMMGWGIMNGLIAGEVSGYEAAAFAAAVLAGASAIYIGKSFENKWTANANAEVEKERAKASPPPAEALRKPDAPLDDAKPPVLEPLVRAPWER